MSKSLSMLEILKVELGNLLNKKRGEYKLSQAKMAEKGGISVRQYIEIEHCKRLPEFRTFANMVKAYEIDANKLFEDISKRGYEVVDKDEEVLLTEE